MFLSLVVLAFILSSLLLEGRGTNSPLAGWVVSLMMQEALFPAPAVLDHTDDGLTAASDPLCSLYHPSPCLSVRNSAITVPDGDAGS